MWLFIGGLVMKAKFLLGAIMALLISQSMQAMQIVFVNNGYIGRIGIKVYLEKFAWNPRTATNEREYILGMLNRIGHPVTLNIPEDNSVNSLKITYYVGYKREDRSLFNQDLMEYNIPLEGNHKIIVSMEEADFASPVGIEVDNNQKIYVPTREGSPISEEI